MATCRKEDGGKTKHMKSSLGRHFCLFFSVIARIATRNANYSKINERFLSFKRCSHRKACSEKHVLAHFTNMLVLKPDPITEKFNGRGMNFANCVGFQMR